MKAKLRVPTLDQYAYIEAEVEGTIEEVFAEYQHLTETVKGGTGLPDKDFNRVLDRYLWDDGAMLADEYGTMNLDQQSIIQVIKRSRKRAESK